MRWDGDDLISEGVRGFVVERKGGGWAVITVSLCHREGIFATEAEARLTLENIICQRGTKP